MNLNSKKYEDLQDQSTLAVILIRRLISYATVTESEDLVNSLELILKSSIEKLIALELAGHRLSPSVSLSDSLEETISLSKKSSQ